MSEETAPAPPVPSRLADPERRGLLRRVFAAIPWGIVGPVLSLALFAGALIVLGNILNEVEPSDVVAAFGATPLSVLALSILFTFLSYLALTGYDGLALRQIGAKDVPYSTAAIGSFTSYAISYTLGFPLLTAGTVRYRVYGAAGLSAPQIAALTLVCTLTFWLGMATVLGTGLIIVPDAVAMVDRLPANLNVAIGVVLLVGVLAYVVFVSTRRRVVNIEGWSLPLPGGRVTMAQIVLGVFDVCMGAAALYVLLPGDAPVDFWTFTVIYVLAAILGVISHAPGGIGVFEATMLIALPSLPRDALLGSLLLFRVVYYFVPFALALAILGVYEMARRRHLLARLVDQAADVMKPLAPILVGGAIFVAGAAVLLTGALPLGTANRSEAVSVFSLAIVEAAHLVVAVLGVGLLFLARGLIRRLRLAWLLSAIVMAACVGLVLMRGAEWRFAALIAAVWFVLLLSRPAFTREAPLVSARFSLWWLGAVASVLAAALWLGFFAHRTGLDADSLWAILVLEAEKARFIRGVVVAAMAAVLILAVATVRRSRLPAADRSTGRELAAMVAAERRPDARLSLLPDKIVLATPSHRAALATARKGRSLIALGDPVGERTEAVDLIWMLRERAEQAGLHPALLAVTPALRPLCLDAGLSLTRIGEVAMLDLDRHGRAGGADDGYTIGLSAPGADPAELVALARAHRLAFGGNEAGFVTGPPSAEWIGSNTCAVLRRAGRIAAFAVLLRGAGDAVWSLDLVRLDPVIAASEGAERLLTRLVSMTVSLARACGARELALGLTPVPGVEDSALGPTWSRVSPRLFAFGDYLPEPRQLRRFLAAFEPRFEPRDLACPGGWALPQILLDVTDLVENGPDPL